MTIQRVIGVVFGVLAVIAFLYQDAAQRKARIRVERLMEAVIAGGTSSDGNIQEAVCQWHHGTKQLPRTDSLANASLDFTKWRREKNLYREIEEYEILGVELEGDSSPEVVRVTVRIDDRIYGMRVINREPITWID